MSREQRAAVDALLRSVPFDATRTPDELREAFVTMMAGSPPPEPQQIVLAGDSAGGG